MRIAMIGQKGFDVGDRGGGVEQHVSQIAIRLAEAGHDVTVYARSRYGQTSDERVSIRYLPTIYRKNVEAIIHTFLCSIDALFRPYDIVHYHGVGPATLSWIPRLFKRKARTVVTFHSQDRYHQKWGRVARFYLWFGEWASVWFPHASIAVSHYIQVYARTKLHRQIIYVPNGANVQTLRSFDELEALDLTPQGYVLSVSRLEPHKGQWYLIEAFKRLEQDYPEVVHGLSLVIVGAAGYGSDYEEELKRHARGSQRILFLGFQSGETLKQLYAHARLFVHASEAEGLPIVVLEAMGFGAPVLVSDIPENLEVIHHSGFTFETKNVSDLMDQLRTLLPDEQALETAGRTGQQMINDQFSWELITQKLEGVYRSLHH
jgi:glycosyltransferase involved in cell wall biosynthesis